MPFTHPPGRYALAACLLLLSLCLTAQTITGTVRGEEETLIGVSITKKGTSSGTVTDLDGKYTIQATPEDVLVFSYTGYTTTEVPVNGQSVINVTMAPDVTSLEEVVVVAYGTQKKSDLTGSVATVGGKELGKFPVANATESLQGRLTGVQVESAGGAPGAGTFVTIRGSGTLSNAQPLYVIDGMLVGNMDNLNPADIESVSVLKDASASALYGSRAANGVVIVTTKKGRPGGLRIEADFSGGAQSAVRRIDWANARQYADIRNRANDNDGVGRSFANDTGFDPNVDTDIQDLSLRTGYIYNTGVRISGGTEAFTFNVSGNYLNEEGIVVESDFSKANARVNSTFNKGRLSIQQTLGLNRTVNNPNFLFNRERDILPTVPFMDAEGNFTATASEDGSTAIYGVGNIGNSVGLATLEDRTVTSYGVLGNIAATFEIIDGLSYKLSTSVDYGNTNNFRFTPTFMFNATQPGSNFISELNESNGTFTSTLIENTLNYSKLLGGKHQVGLLAGYSRQVSNFRSLGSVARNFPNNNIRVASAAQTFANAPAFNSTEALLSSFGRVTYAYDSRYLFTGTLRRDGSSLFREDLRYGIFPSVAVGWNISNEDFWNPTGLINELKLRASYGEIGSNNTQPYGIDPQLNLNSAYPFGAGSNQVRQTGFSITNIANSDIQWETTTTTDIGLEAALLDNKLKLTADYFVKNTNDILVNLVIPPSTGGTNRPAFNAASVRNSGIELGINYGNFVGDFNWSVGANFSTLNNEVTELSGDPIVGGQFTSNGLRSTLTDVGQPIGAFYGYRQIGVYQTDAEAEADGRTDARAGDFRFEDINGDGMLNEEDQTYIGSPIPDFTYGFNFNFFYKSFDATLLFNGVAGNEILNANIYRGYFDTEGNYLADALNGWTPENPSQSIPRNTLTDQAFNRRTSTFYLESGSYFRLRNLQIGYTLPSSVVSGQGAFSRVRAFLNVQNLFTITDYTGYYPEVGRNGRGGTNIFNAGVDEAAYPTPRTIMFGLQVGL